MSGQPAWVEEYGYDDAISQRLWTLIDVPERPYGLPWVLSVFERAVDVTLETVEYADADALRTLSSAANDIRNSLNEREDLPHVHRERATARGYYDRYPLYGALHHPVPESPHDHPYLLLIGIMIILSPLIIEERHRVRYATYCRAVRTLAEQTFAQNEAGSSVLLEHLLPALDAAESPGVCLRRMRDAARSSQYSDHARVLCHAWRHVVQQTPPRAGAGNRGGRRGYQAVRGIPAGPHHAHMIVQPRGLSSEYSAVERVADMGEADGPGRAGEARADAATPGSADPGDSDDGHSVPYFDRRTMYRHRRHIQTRRRNRAQDTTFEAMVWTPVQTATLVQTAVAIVCDEAEADAELVYGVAMLLVGLMTGVDRDTLAGIDYRAQMPESVESGMVVTADGWIAWRPPVGQSVLCPPASPMRDAIRTTVRWVVVPRPGLICGLDHVLAQDGCRDRRTAYNRALQSIGQRVGFSVTTDKIRRQWWGWMARARGQPVVASAMTGYVRPSCGVPMHYVHVSPDVQQRTYAEAYAAFAKSVRGEYLHAGLAWPPEWNQLAHPATSPMDAGYGSPIVPADEALEDGLQRCVDRAGFEHKAINADAVNRMTVILYHLVTLACGLRPVRARASHAALILRGFSVITDKDTPRYSMARHVPIPTRLHRELTMLWREREKLIYASGLHGVGHLPDFPDVPIIRDDLISELAKPVSSLSLVKSRQHSVLTIERPYRLRSMGLDLDLPNSWQRHWLRTAMLQAGVPDQLANLRMGHACIGHDPYDPDSCIRPAEACQAAAHSVEERLARLLEKLVRRL